jgi:hypothetical protein
VQHALAAHPEDGELRMREAVLLDDWRDHLLGPLGRRHPNRYGELELWFGAAQHLADCTADDLAPLLASRFPALRVLRLMNAEFSDDLAVALAGSPLAAALAVLDLSCGTLTDAGAEALAAARPAFARLEVLHVDECCLTPAGVRRLLGAGLPVIAKLGSSGIEASQKAERYVSVHE